MGAQRQLVLGGNNMKENTRKIGFTNEHTAPRTIRNTTANSLLGGYSLKKWESSFKKYWPMTKKILRFYLKAFKALLVLFLAGMALTFALVMIGEVLPALPEKMPQLYHVVEDLLIPYYENFFAVISKECSFTPPSL